MLWFALHLPQLSLEAFSATLAAETRQRPIALVADHRITAVNRVAALCGVRPGIKRATALALSVDLLLAQAEPTRDAAALQAVVHAALAFTPSVCAHDTHTVLLEVQASLRLFGGAAALLMRLRQALMPLGHRVHLSAAPTALGAAWLACWQPKRTNLGANPGADPDADPGADPDADLSIGPHTHSLAALQTLLDGAPLALSGAGQTHADAFLAMGLHTLRQLRLLPRSGLARRFGQGLLDDLDKAYGLRPDPRLWLQAPAVFESRLELLARADSSEQVLHGAAVLVARLVAWAQARHSRVAAFTLCMQHEPRHRRHDSGTDDDGGSDAAPTATVLHVPLAEPALDPAHLQLLLRERLQHVALAAPTLELRLQCQHLVQASAPNGELFPTHSSRSEGLTRLLERLRARLGDDHVLRLVPVADHRPEHASRAEPVQTLVRALVQTKAGMAAASAQALAPNSASTPARTTTPTQVRDPLPLHRPAWLLPEPLPLAERDALPLLDGRPLQLLSGPERIEAGWWDGHTVTRDYFIAQSEDGALVWLWRGRLPVVQGEVNWFLQGRFA